MLSFDDQGDEIMSNSQHMPGRLRERIFTRSPLSLENQLEAMIAMAKRHIWQARERIARQRAMVFYQRAKGWDSRLAEDLLQAFEDALANQCHHRERLRAFVGEQT